MMSYEQKYATRNPLMVLKALAYFNDLDFAEPVRLLNGAYKWETVATRLHEMILRQDEVFPVAPLWSDYVHI